MESLEDRVNDSKEIKNEGFLTRIGRNKWLRRSLLPILTSTSLSFGLPGMVRSETSQQQTPLNHDPVLFIHGFDIDFKDSIEEYVDFDQNRVVDFDDFFQFSDRFGAREGDAKYDRGFDINRDGTIDYDDFYIFADNFHKVVDPPGSTFNRIVEPLEPPLESTWNDLSNALSEDLGWTDGGAIGKWVPSNNLGSADFYKLRLSSGNDLTFTKQGEEVKYAVDKINQLTGKNVILVGFSMGGLSARAYLQNYTDTIASALVTICTPHVGSYLAYLPEEKSKIEEWELRFKNQSWWVSPLAKLFFNYASYASKDKPVIRDLEPCSDSLRALNNNIHGMPDDILYANIVSQVPNQEILDWKLELINKYLLNYERCKAVESATPGLLAKGDGVVPTLCQLLSYAILNTNAQNLEWYDRVKDNLIENAEMQVSHLDGTKQTEIIMRVLDEIIRKTSNNAPNKPYNSSPHNFATDVPLEVLLDWDGSDPDNDKLTYTVYFEKNDSTPDQILNSGLSESEIRVSNLENDVNYYWQVVASDGKLSTTGDVWRFTTESIPFDGTRIAFLSNIDEKNDDEWEIYVMNSDGSNRTRLTSRPGKDQNHSWSPDGLRIVFVSIDRYSYDGRLYIINSDGTGLIDLTDESTVAYFPMWSPDGNKIAFEYDRAGEIYTINTDGTGLRNLTNNPAEDRFPMWSPDGNKIAFISDKGGRSGVHIMDSDGNNQINLTRNPGSDYGPIFWSPDGTRIAFVSDRDYFVSDRDHNGWYGEIYVMNSDGSNQTRLTNDPETNKWNPLWSPDGNKIAFQLGGYDLSSRVYIINSDGTNLRELARGWDPSWSPDGTKIVFVSGDIGSLDIYVMNSDGSNQINLTMDLGGSNVSPVWSPH